LSSRKTIPLVTAVFALCLVAGPAAAQEDAGRIHFQAGAADYETGDYEPALREFLRAYELSQRPELFYNIAISYQQLGDLEHAIEYLGRYLAEVENLPNRTALERRMQNLQRRLDEEREQEAPGLSATATTGTTAAVAGNEVQTTNDDEAQTNDDNAEPSESASGGGANIPAIVSFSAGGVGLVMAVTFGALALAENSSVSDQPCAATRTCTNAGSIDTFALLSDIGTGLAIVGVGLGVVFLLTAADDDGESNQAGVNFAPFVGPGTAGLAARGNF